MNWIHFFLWIAGFYSLYYLTMILYDASLSSQRELQSVNTELTFSETHLPQQVELIHDKSAEQKRKPASTIIGSGGVTLKNLFTLAREEAIIYTPSESV